MKKTIAAASLSLALAAASLNPSPAIAGDRDMVGPALAGLGLLAVIAAASMSDGERNGDGSRRIDVRNAPQEPAWGYRAPERKAHHDTHRAPSKQHALPAACARDMRHDGRRQSALSEKCLRQNGMRGAEIQARRENAPDQRGKPGNRTGWTEDSLRSHRNMYR